VPQDNQVRLLADLLRATKAANSNLEARTNRLGSNSNARRRRKRRLVIPVT
jgi:hypothetical protein